MTTDNVTTWRDLADRLTAEQIAQFERYEADYPDPDGAAWMMVEARELVERNAAEVELFGHLPIPAGAVVFSAERDADGNWFRSFAGSVRRVAGVCLGIEGNQYADGRITRELTITVNDLPDANGHLLTAEQARALSAVLLALADQLETLQPPT